MTIASTKVAGMILSATALALFYDKAIQSARSLVERAREVMVSAEMMEFDRRLLAQWDIHGAPPSDPFQALQSQFDFRGQRKGFEDYWAMPYVVRSDDNGYEIRSSGPDRILGTSDDLTIRRSGLAVESRLHWFKDPGEIVCPMKNVAVEQSRLLETQRRSLSASSSTFAHAADTNNH